MQPLQRISQATGIPRKRKYFMISKNIFISSELQDDPVIFRILIFIFADTLSETIVSVSVILQ